MKKFKLPITVDLTFIFIALFFIFYAVFTYSGVNVFITIVLSLLLGLAISGIIAVFLIKSGNKKYYAEMNSDLLNGMINALIFMPRSELLGLFAEFYKKDGLSSQIIDDGILIEDKNLFIYPIFKYEKITTEDIVLAYHKKKNNRLVILAPEYSTEAVKLCSSVTLNVTLFSATDVFISLKNADMLPKNQNVVPVKEPKLFNKLKGVINKKYSKFFFVAGILSLLFSTFVYFSIYYIIWGTVFLIISAVCKFFATENKKNNGINL